MGFMAPDQEEEARVGEECGILPKTDDMRLRRIRDRPFPTKVTDDDAAVRVAKTPDDWMCSASKKLPQAITVVSVSSTR
jgi:hypothetical protein